MSLPPSDFGDSRRAFLKQATGLVGLTLVPHDLMSKPPSVSELSLEDAATSGSAKPASGARDVTLQINGQSHTLALEPRVTLLDALRERLDLPGTKKGCDHGACGACTVLIDGQRVVSCLTLAVMAQGKKITTIEGLATGDQLHPMQQAFLDCDGFQCGYCTAGQIMSAVGCVHENHARDDAEIREFMSGNLCRCGAYPNIRDAIQKAAPLMKEGAA